MQLKRPDQLSTLLIWVAAIFMAVKEGFERTPPLRDALPDISAGWLNFVPLLLLMVAASVTMARSGGRKPEPIKPTQRPIVADASRAKILDGIRQARSNGAVAVAQGTFRTRMKAIHEIEAVLLTLKKEFGMTPVSVTAPNSEEDCKLILELYVRFLDSVYPLLREGHVAEARTKSEALRSRLTP